MMLGVSAYTRMDIGAATERVQEFARRFDMAPDAGTALAVLRDWNVLRCEIDAHEQRAHVMFQTATHSERAAQERAYWDSVRGEIRNLNGVFARAVTSSPHAAALDATFGPRFLELKRCELPTFAESIADDTAREAELVTKYVELLSRRDIAFRGATHSVTSLAAFFDAPERDVRLAAQQARERHLGHIGGDLGEIFDQLVKRRDAMGRALGFDGYAPLGDRMLHRIGYDARDLAALRAAIRSSIVPLAERIMARRAQMLGVDRALLHDEPVAELGPPPRPRGGAALLARGLAGLGRPLGPAWDEFTRVLMAESLLDLDARDDKAPGGFTTTFADAGVPFLFVHTNGSMSDVTILVHELGHAFQLFMSRHQPLLEYRLNSPDTCEIHAMGMESLGMSELEGWFSREGAARCARMRLEQRVVDLAYYAAIDEFQRGVYAEPGMNVDERNELWRELERQYLPYRSYGGLFPYFEAGGIWQRQLHVFAHPLYYIDYAIADAVGLQLWARADDADTWARYLEVCRRGGSIGMSEIVETLDVMSPFDPDCFGRVAERLAGAFDW